MASLRATMGLTIKNDHEKKRQRDPPTKGRRKKEKMHIETNRTHIAKMQIQRLLLLAWLVLTLSVGWFLAHLDSFAVVEKTQTNKEKALALQHNNKYDIEKKIKEEHEHYSLNSHITRTHPFPRPYCTSACQGAM